MKGERRHELQHNALADYITGVVTSVKPYSNAILGCVLLVAVAAAGYLWWSRDLANKEEEGCDEFLALKSKAGFELYDLDGFKKRHEGTKVSFRVLTFAGDMGLIDGSRKLFTNKADAHEELGKAEKSYNEVLAECDDPAKLLQATFGLARIHESLGRLEQAVERYEEVGEKWPGTACASQAKKRLEFLAQADSTWFYDRFAEYDPTPKTEPLDPGILPFDPSSLPEPPGSGGGSSMLDLPSLGGGSGDTGKTEPDDTGDDDGTEADPKSPPTEPAIPDTTEPAIPDTTEPAIPDTTEPAIPDTTEPAIPDTTEPADSDTDAAPPVSR